MWIDATDIAQWADRRECQDTMPMVIRRLVHATTDNTRRVGFPSGTSVQTGGWDGVIDVPEGNAFVPTGLSLWELSCEKGSRAKAEQDFLKRTNNSLGHDPSTATFVFLTPRRWSQKSKSQWAQGKKQQGPWADVRAYDADDLEQWLELAPTVAAWLALRIGKYPSGCEPIDDWWAGFSRSTSPPIPSTLVLAGRNAQVDALTEWLRSGSDAIQVKADSPEEALAFLGAIVERLQEEEKACYISRIIVARDAETIRQLTATKSKLILAWDASDTSSIGAVVDRGHRVFLPCGREVPGSRDSDIVLKRLPHEEFIEALRKSGIPENRAEALARHTGRSLSVLRRRLAIAAAVGIPQWAKPENSLSLIPALLATSWDESNESDKEALSGLANQPYEEFARMLVRWSNTSDAPVRRAGSVWSLQAPVDAWFLLGRYVTRDDLTKLQDASFRVLGEEDPRFELAAEERWLAPVRGKKLAHSWWLRNGLAETLALISVFGEEAGLVADLRPADFVERIVWKLVGNVDFQRRWRSLAGLLPRLAEAAPESFLRAVEDLLDNQQITASDLYEEEGMFGASSPYLYFMWALEGLAWDSIYLARAAVLLARMAKLDPGGRLSNRPAGSLRHIFLVWRPSTDADLGQRLGVIDLLLNREPEVGWNLLLGLLPKGHDISHNTHEPEWRQKAPRKPVTRGEYAKGAAAIIDHSIHQADQDGLRLSELISDASRWPASQREALQKRLREFELTCKDTTQRKIVWDALRSHLNMHRTFAGEKWTMPPEELAQMEELYISLEPLDTVEKHLWLFGEHWPKVPRPIEEASDKDFKSRDAQAAELRRNAVLDVFETCGIDGLASLALNAKQPHLVGWAAADVVIDSDSEWQVLERTLGSTQDSLRTFGRAFVARCAQDRGDSWVMRRLDDIQRAGWAPVKLADFCLALPINLNTWEIVRGCGEEVDRAYWEQCYPYAIEKDSGESIQYAIEKLLKHVRFAAALQFAAGWHSQVSTASLLAVLSSEPSKIYEECQRQPGQHLPFEIEIIIKELESRKEVSEEQVGQLEWTYLPLFEHTTRHPLVLHGLLSKDPSFFAEAVRWAFRPEDGSEPDDSTAELSVEMQQARARLAYELLDSFHTVPGSNSAGALDEVALGGWVRSARKLCAALKRGAISDERLGNLLSYSPAGSDGVWPHPAVRDLIEEISSRHLEEGISIGVYNSRGVVTKSPGEGGGQERELSATYRTFSEATATQWPRTSALLRQIAEQYDREARAEDIRSEQLDL